MAEAEKEKVLSEGKITEEALEKLRDLQGSKLRIPHIFNDLASKTAIRNFANGIGDANPLWRDEEYAKKTSYGQIIAPPSWLYSIFPTWVSIGLPGVHGFHSGSEWDFYKPIRVNDVIVPDCILTHFEDKTSSFAGRIIIIHYDSHFHNQENEVVAKCHSWSIRAERSAARKTGKYSQIQLPHPWTEEELKAIEDEVLAEETRGNKTCYWEDVSVGEELKPVVKGPFGLTDMVSYCVGAAPVPMFAHGLALDLFRRHPAWGFRDPNTFAKEPIYAVHYNKAAANAAGLPFPYDVGTQRQCWLMHLLTNWTGDEGWLKKNYAEYRRFVYFSDAVWFRGKVTKKYVDEDGEYCVDIKTTAINQRGEDTAPGHSTVALPSRNNKVSPVEQRLK
ncbi:MAG: MaoC family dehydratase N-terminal domain-containing protein [Chloroflexota bacterium]